MIIDIKTGSPERWHELQTAGYAGMDRFTNLSFDGEQHIYSVDGIRLPSVTMILQEVADMKGDEQAMARGTAVHEAGALLAQKKLDWSTVDSRLLGYVTSLALWLETTGFVVEHSERQGWHSLHGYAGTLDLQGTLPAALRTLRRGALYAQEDGSIARFKAHTNPTDFSVFISVLNVWRWKRGDS